MIGLPGPEHLLFIPAVLLVGATIGYLLGARAERERAARRSARARE